MYFHHYFVLLFLRLFSSLLLPPGITAQSITCEGSGSPIYVPLTADFTLGCTYSSQHPVFAIRLDAPPGHALATKVFTTNRNWSKVPGLALTSANDESINLTFSNFTWTHYRSNYQLIIIDHDFKRNHENIDIQLAKTPVVTLATDAQETGYDDMVIGVVGQPKTVVCNVTEAVPKATLNWTLNGVDVTADATTVADGNDQFSSLTFTPTKSHHEVELKCRATNDATRRLEMDAVEGKANFRLDTTPSKTV